MSQTGIQLASRFDALTSLLNCIKYYTEGKGEVLEKSVLTERKTIYAKSVPDEVMNQKNIINDTLNRIIMIT